jgi:hypothetical protein
MGTPVHLTIQLYNKMRSKMKIVLSILISIIFVINFSGCGTNNDEKAKLKYGIGKFERQSNMCDSIGCAKIVLEYPVIKVSFSGAINDSLENYIQAALLDNYSELNIKTVDEMAERFFKDYEESRKDFPDRITSWEINNSISVIYNENSIVSFLSEFYHYTGGAHGNSGIYFSNFNSQTGEKLELLDILIPGYENELNKAAEKIFRIEKQLSANSNLESEGFWFEGNKFSLNKNFGIKNEGLIFYFNSYEIAPYAMGPTEILIPYKEIKNLVKQDGSLNKVIAELK